MPIYPGTNERISWYLPLVGGAEMNRIRIPDPVIFTSRPYPIAYAEGLGIDAVGVSLAPTVNYTEAMSLTGRFVGGSAQGTVYTEYKNYKPEAVAIVGRFIGGAAQTTIYTKYKGYKPEAVSIVGRFAGGSAQAQRIEYHNYKPEAMNIVGTFISGTATRK